MTSVADSETSRAAARPTRVTVVLTHPIQYYSPWFRYVTGARPELALSVVYATVPTAEQQGTGFGRPFQWDVPLLEGYSYTVARAARAGDRVDADHLFGIDGHRIGAALLETNPDVVLVPGWHSAAELRAIHTCRRHGIPLLYRGDTYLQAAPRGVKRSLWHAKTRRLLGLFDAYLSVGKRAGAYLRYFGVPESKIFATPHMVDNEFFRCSAAGFDNEASRRAARQELGVPVDADVVLFVGKLEPKKRPLDLIAAAADLQARRRVHVLIAGSGSLEAECREQAARLGVSVTWAGFQNQASLGRIYAVADCLALPSDWSETWGLVVNEAMATGLPCVVSDRVGCGPDLVLEGETGATFRAGDTSDLAAALDRVLAAGGRRGMGAGCRDRIERNSFSTATDGLIAACRFATSRAPARGTDVTDTRVLACCGGMVLVGGAERMTFEVLRTLRARGAAVHCIVNSWQNEHIAAQADLIGASWSTGFYGDRLERRVSDPRTVARMLIDIARTSAGLLRDARRFRPTDIFIPEVATAVRNAPALALLKLAGTRIVFRLSNAPEPGRFYRALWGRLLPPLVTTFVPNSQFSATRLRESGVENRQIRVITNAVSRRRVADSSDADVVALVNERKTVAIVGQIAPFKGTHLAVDAVLDLLDRGYDIQAVVVGHFPVWPADMAEYVRSLRARVASSRFHDRIHFVGPRENVLAIMRASYLLAAPIVQAETFGNVVLEAASVGLPAVAFANGGIPELIEHGVTGYLCSEGTHDALVAGIRYYLDDPTARAKAGCAALARVNAPGSTYASDVFARAWAQTFGMKTA